jgi:hypothetical protein
MRRLSSTALLLLVFTAVIVAIEISSVAARVKHHRRASARIGHALRTKFVYATVKATLHDAKNPFTSCTGGISTGSATKVYCALADSKAFLSSQKISSLKVGLTTTKEKFTDELGRLATLATGGVLVPKVWSDDTGKLFDVKCHKFKDDNKVLEDANTCVAYIMDNLSGVELERNDQDGKGRLYTAFNELLPTPKGVAKADIANIITYYTTQKRIPDLQGILDTSTGHFYVFDPGHLNTDASDVDKTLIAKTHATYQDVTASVEACNTCTVEANRIAYWKHATK